VTETMTQVQTLAELFRWRVLQSPQAPAYLVFDAPSGNWLPMSWQSVAERVDCVAGALEALQLPRGARIALLLPNGIDAVTFDQAALALACVPVPLHALDNAASIAYILADSQASVLVAQSLAQWQAIAASGLDFPSLQQVVIAGEPVAEAAAGGPAVQGLANWMSKAVGAPAVVRQGPEPDELAALVYTSGTTGKPKGVMLSHRNVLENVMATLQRVAPAPGDIFLSFLPLSHTFERTAGYYLPIAVGSCVAHARSVALLAEDLKQVRPTILISVPRIYERVFLAIQAGLAASPFKARLFNAAQATGWRRFCRAQHLPVPGNMPGWLDQLLWPVFNRLVARAVRAPFGGRLRAAVSGGAALSPTIAHCFLGLGVPLLQGYGMTETSPVVAANALDDNDPATIGRVLPGVQVRIGANRELQVQGPNVMRGYWKREADTEAAFVDGWLRTGDQAEIVDGRIRILGRIKELIVTSTGEKIAPADLEQAIAADPLFEQVYAFGDDKPFIACAVVLSQPGWKQLAAEAQLDPDQEASWRSPAIAERVVRRIVELTAGFPRYAQPRLAIVSLQPWTAENSLLTPTLKLKRHNLAHYFKADIERIYQRGQRQA
jgi:long-chain acyl-CoA synthetase